jgi:hypothetical protein
MNIPKPLNTLILFGFLVSSLHGGVIPGRWEKVDGLVSGSKIVLTSEAGDRVRYTFQKSDSGFVNLRHSQYV